MVLAMTESGLAGVNLATGAVIRTANGDDCGVESASDHRNSLGEPIYPYDVVRVSLSDYPQLADPSQPEAAETVGKPVPDRRLAARRTQRIIKSLLAPDTEPLLGFVGQSTCYWTLTGDHPSVALVELVRPPVLYWQDRDGQPAVRFSWGARQEWLLCQDPLAIAVLQASGARHLGGENLSRALGFQPSHLVVTLTPPKEGYCYKVVSSLLPKPAQAAKMSTTRRKRSEAKRATVAS